MKNILAAPIRESVTSSRPPFDGQSDFAGDGTRWSVVERRLLSPARKAVVECLVRLERADGERPHWQPGDSIELCGPLDHAGATFDSLSHLLPGARHGAVSLLPGGWPVQAGCVHRSEAKIRLPIASSADSGTLDLLVFAGSGGIPALETEASQSLLFEMTINLRILMSPADRMSEGPLLFIGDLGTVALARAFLQEGKRNEQLFLLESGHEDALILSEAIFPHGCWRDGTVRAMPRRVDARILSRILEAQGGKIGSLVEEGGQIVVAGASGNFPSMACDCLSRVFGDEAMMLLERAGRLKRIIL